MGTYRSRSTRRPCSTPLNATASASCPRSPSELERTPMSHVREPVLDREGLLDRVDGDRSLLLDMIQIFTEQVPGLTGALRQAVAGGDAQALRRTAHTVKGVTAELAAPNARRLAMTLEDLGVSGQLADAPAVLADLEAELELLSRDLALLAED